MIYFFKMKRWLSIKNQKFFKYSKYAIGEILIVIIGIIVALLLHNWNEKRKDRDYFNKVLAEVERELIMNIETARATLNFYNKADSLTVLVFHDSLTYEHYQNSVGLPSLRNVIFANPATFIKDDAFKKLHVNSHNITEEQDSVSEDLFFLYNDLKDRVDEYSDILTEFIQGNKDYYINSPWYSDHVLALSREESYKYFLTSGEYRNRVTRYAELALNVHRMLIEFFDIEAVACYRRIHKYLNEKEVAHIDSLYFEYDANDYKELIGVYNVRDYPSSIYFKQDSSIISIEDGKLMQSFYDRGRAANNKRELIPLNKYHYRDQRGAGFFRVRYDEDGNVEGFTWSNGVNMLKFYKVK